MDDGQSAGTATQNSQTTPATRAAAGVVWLAVPGLSRHLQPVDAGQHHVEQNEIRLPGMHRLQRGLAVCGLDDREPSASRQPHSTVRICGSSSTTSTRRMITSSPGYGREPLTTMWSPRCAAPTPARGAAASAAAAEPATGSAARHAGRATAASAASCSWGSPRDRRGRPSSVRAAGPYGSRPGGRRPPRLKDRLHSSYQPARGSRAMTAPSETERTALAARRQRLRDRILAPPERRPPTAGRGIHHAALICSDPERTIGFYQELLGFPLVELVQNRDYPGSSHFFFDVGNSTLLGFFDFPGLGLGPAVEAIGGVQHIAVSVPPDRHAELRARLDDAGVPYAGPDRGIEESLYLRDPDGIQIELLRDELLLFGGRRLDAS